MGTADTPELPADERDAFLGTGGTGVLALSTADGDPPHALPVSYGYDGVESTSSGGQRRRSASSSFASSRRR